MNFQLLPLPRNISASMHREQRLTPPTPSSHLSRNATFLLLFHKIAEEKKGQIGILCLRLKQGRRPSCIFTGAEKPVIHEQSTYWSYPGKYMQKLNMYISCIYTDYPYIIAFKQQNLTQSLPLEVPRLQSFTTKNFVFTHIVSFQCLKNVKRK